MPTLTGPASTLSTKAKCCSPFDPLRRLRAGASSVQAPMERGCHNLDTIVKIPRVQGVSQFEKPLLDFSLDEGETLARGLLCLIPA